MFSRMTKRTLALTGLIFSLNLAGCGTPEQGSETDYWRYKKKKSTKVITTPVTPAPSMSMPIGMISVKVGFCYDGDTCNVEKLNDKGQTIEKMTIRMGGIDAPEVSKGGQPFSKEARDFTNKKLRNKVVSLREIENDMYGRMVGEFYIGNELINILLVQEGLAEHYKWGSKKIDHSRYAKAQLSAENLQKGIWSLDDYETPYEFRERTKNDSW